MIKLNDTLRLYGVMLLVFGAVLVSSIFIHYMMDLSAMNLANYPELQMLYETQYNMSVVSAACSGGVLGFIALIVLLFFIRHYIAKNQANMGILKALGHSESTLAASFLKFGLPVFIGALIGYLLSLLILPGFYSSMNSDLGDFAPEVTVRLSIAVALVLCPTLLFSLVSFCFSYRKLKKPPLDMIRRVQKHPMRKRLNAEQIARKNLPFLPHLQCTMRKAHPVLTVFVGIAGWGFGAMLQMAFTMLSIGMSAVAPMICAPVGILMGFITLVTATDFILSANRKYISLMKAYGYTDRECFRSLLSGYRPVAWFGFLLGGPYQFFFLKLMVSLYAGSYSATVNYSFVGLAVTLALFVLCYEGVMAVYKRRLEKITLKEVMLSE